MPMSYPMGHGVSAPPMYPQYNAYGGFPQAYTPPTMSNPPYFIPPPSQPPTSSTPSPALPTGPSSSLFVTSEPTSQSSPTSQTQLSRAVSRLAQASPVAVYEDFATQQDRQAGMNSNQMRNESMQRNRSHPSGRSLPPAPTSAGETSRRSVPVHTYPSSSTSAGSTAVSHDGITTKQGTFVILPYTPLPEYRNTEDIPPPFSWRQSEMGALFRRHADVGLTVTVDFPRSGNIFQPLHHAFVNHLTSRGFQFADRPANAAPVAVGPAPVLDIDNAPWIILQPKYRPTNTTWRLVLPSASQLLKPADVTVATLSKATNVGWACNAYEDWVFFLAPRYGNLQQKLSSLPAGELMPPPPHPEAMHPCFPGRVFATLRFSPPSSAEAGCLTGCPQDTPASPASPAQTLRSISPDSPFPRTPREFVAYVEAQQPQADFDPRRAPGSPSQPANIPGRATQRASGSSQPGPSSSGQRRPRADSSVPNVDAPPTSRQRLSSPARSADDPASSLPGRTVFVPGPILANVMNAATNVADITLVRGIS
ncbi:hypothetical protein BC835DRAFT_1424728 [Cytidiella melzeri]|nr:hypothetical protein BC835DRAFT_1424728 [Cytidiella melzeri]